MEKPNWVQTEAVADGRFLLGKLHSQVSEDARNANRLPENLTNRARFTVRLEGSGAFHLERETTGIGRSRIACATFRHGEAHVLAVVRNQRSWTVTARSEDGEGIEWTVKEDETPRGSQGGGEARYPEVWQVSRHILKDFILARE